MTSTESVPPMSDGVTSDGAVPDLGARLAGVQAGLAAVVERLAVEADRAAARERVIDRQHADIERLRATERSGVLRPVVTDLYRLRNDLLKQVDRTPAEMSGDRVRALLRSYAEEVADALERCGISALPVAVGEAFDPGRHQAAGVTPTDDPASAGTVAEVLADGYQETETGRVVAPARVLLYR